MSVTTAWTMLHGAIEGVDGWAQVGFGRFRNFPGVPDGRQTFSQWTQCDGCSALTRYSAPPAIGSNYHYQVVYNWATHVLWMLANGQLIDVTNFDPYTGAWHSPVNSQLAAETYYCESDIIGTLSSAAAFNNIQGENSQAVWAPYSDLELVTPNCSRYGQKWGAKPRLFYVWTK
jgi:hypothetical protein